MKITIQFVKLIYEDRGKVFYRASVNGMTNKQGFFELKAKDNNELKIVLENHPSVEKINEEEGKLLVYLKSDLAAEELNQFLFQKNIVLQHLVKRKHSLEAQFLELTNNHQSN